MNLSTRANFDVAYPEIASLLGSSISTGDPDQFRMFGTHWVFGSVEVTRLSLTAFTYAGDTKARSEAVAKIVFVLDGRVNVRSEDGAFSFGADAAAFLPDGHLPELSCSDTARVLSVTFPRAAFPGADFPFGDRQFAAISASVIRSEPALGFLVALTETARTNSIRSAPTAMIILKLLTGLLVSDRAWDNTTGFRPDLAELHRVITKHSADPAFDTKALARQLHTSPRTLNKSLEQKRAGEHAADLITEHRLVTAMTLLQPGTHLTIEQIAEQSGFRTAQHLETAIENTCGLTTTALLETQHHIREHEHQ